ncbi:MAG TPA: MBG domain-containing protein [Anaerolineales bacterium]|nr:MBG domain-containing protein [Anaerolineales bacterium]
MKNKFLNALLIALMLFQATAPMTALAYVGTDQEDYTPGSVVTIYGDNSNGAGYLPGESVHVEVWGPNDYQVNCDPAPVVADDGSWSCQVTLWNDWRADGLYYYAATGLHSGVREEGTFTDAIAFGTAQTGITSGASGNANTTLSIPKPTGTATGDFLLAQITVEKGSDVTITAPAGWNLVLRTNHSTDLGQAIYYKFAAAGDPANYVWTFSQAVKAAGGIARYTGVDTTNPIVTSSGNTGTSNPLTALSVNATTNSVLVALFGVKKNTTLTDPGGMTNRYSRQNPQDVSIRAADQLITTAGATGNRTSNAASVDKWVAQMVVLREAVVCTAPAMTTQPTNQTVTYGDNAVFTAAASGTSPSLQWQQSTDSGANWNNIPGATTSPLTITTPGVSQSGTQYRAVFTNTCGTVTSNAATLTVNRRSITVTANAQNKVYGIADPALTYQVTTGSLVGSDTFSGALARAAGEAVGTYAIGQGTLALSNNYMLSFVGANLTITERPIEVTADDKGKQYGDPDPALTYSITGGSLAFSDVFTGELDREDGEALGTYDILQGTLALSSNYALTFVPGTFTIGTRAITVTADPQSKLYGEDDPEFTYEITSGSLVSGDSFTGALARAAGEDVGSYAISQGSLALNSNYALTFIGANLTIDPRPVTVKADDQTKVYGEDDPALTYEITSGTLVGSDSFSGALERDPGEDAGAYTIGQGTLALSSNYDLTFVDGELTITRAGLTVTADDQTITYGQPDPAFTFEYSGFIDDDDANDVDTPPTCSVSGAHADAGEYDIVCSGGLDNNYSFSYVNGTLTVEKALLTVTADDQTATYGDVPVFTFQYAGFQHSDDAGDVDIAPTCNVAGPHTNVGTYTITCFGGVDNNYDFTYANGTLTVKPAALTITADVKSKTYGDANPTLTASYDGFVNGDGPEDLDTPVALATTADASSPVGGYPITASGASDANYTISFVNGTLTVNARLLTITADDQNKTYGEPFTFTGTEFSVVGLVNGDDVASVTLTSTGAAASAPVGDYPIVASNATGSGLDNYTISYENGTLSVGPKALTITADDQNKTYGEDFTFDGTEFTTDGLVNGDSVNSVTLTSTGAPATAAAGSHDILVSNAVGSGLDNYTISYVDGTFTVEQKLLTITANNQSKTYGAAFTFDGTEFTSDGLVNDDEIDSVTLTSAGAAPTAAAGSYPIIPSAAVGTGLSNYTIDYINGAFVVDPKGLTIIADDLSKTYGDTLTFTGTEFTILGLVNSDTVDSVSLTSDGAAATAAVGSYAILASDAIGMGLDNYIITYQDGELTVSARPITITADPKSKVYGGLDPALTYSITSGELVNGDTISGGLVRESGEDVDTYDILQGTLSLSTNYDLTFVPGVFTIELRQIEVTADDKSKTYGDADPDLTYTITGGSLAAGDEITGALARDPGEDVGEYAITQGTLALNSNYTLAFVEGTLSITKKAASVTPDAAGKTYGDNDPVLTGTLSGFLPADGVTASYSRTAGEDVGTYTISATLSPVDVLDNYEITYNTADFDIDPRAVQVTADAKTKVYGNTDSALTYQITAGSLAFSDAFIGELERAAGEDVGSYAILQGSLALNSNYELSYVGANLEITQRPVTVTADDKSKTYGDTDPGLTYQITSGSLAFSDAITGELDRDPGENVGSYAIIQGTLALSANYDLTFVPGTLDITVRSIEVTADDKSKTYGDTDPALTYEITGGSLAFSDVFTGTMSREVGEDVGTYAITKGTLALSANYDLTFVPGTLEITQKAASVTPDAASKIYGAADPIFTGTLVGFLPADAVTATYSRTAGETVLGGPYTISATLSPVDALSNYDITYNTAEFMIDPKAASVTPDAAGKTYGDADPALTGVLSGFLSEDGVTASYSRTNGEDVGAYTITATLDPASVLSNYDITYNTADFTITRRPVEVTADARSKIYGNADPALTYQITAGSLAFSDAFTGTLTRAAGEDVGMYAITQGTLSLSDNYDLSFVGSNLTITERPVEVTADARSKIYGNADPALTYQVTEGSLAFSDAFTGALERVTGENVGSYAITQGTLTLSDNYDLTFVPGTLEITTRAIEVTADDKSKTYGDADPALTYEITSGTLAFNDAFIGTLERDPGEDVDTYDILQGTLALSTNYDLAFVPGTLDIITRAVEVTADDKSKTYGDADPALTYTITGGSLAFSDEFTGALARDLGEDVGEYAITQGTMALSDNYDLTFVPGTLEITQKAASVTPDAAGKTYGDSDPVLTGTLSGFLPADGVTASYSRTAGEDVGTYTISATLSPVDVLDNYEITYNTADFTITPRPVEVTANAKTKVYGEADPELTYFISSGSLAFSDAFTGTMSREVGEDVGMYAIAQGTLSLNDNYELSFVGANLTITERLIEVTADARSKVYGNSDPALTYQITSGSLAFSDAFNGALSRAAGENVGSYAIGQGSLALSSNYDLTFVGADLSITERPITVTADAKSKVYGGTDPALTYQITSGDLVFGDAFSGAITRVAGENVGMYAITQGTLALSSNYALNYIGENFEITKALLTVTADNQSKLFGDANPAFTFQYSGFVNSENASVIDTAPTCGVTVPHAAVGSYPIVCSGGLDNNYSFTYVNGVLTVGTWTLKGFYQPVDMPGASIVYNTVKGGATVPLKFEIISGSTELTALSNVKSLTYAQTSCTATATSDDIETTATGGTVLRYDSTSGQFVYNWQTPKTPGKCYRVTMTTLDGSTLVAYFKLK